MIIQKILKHLSPDLLHPTFVGSSSPVGGHCYIASEAAYYLFAKDEGYKPYFLYHEGSPHWFLAGGYCTTECYEARPIWSLANGQNILDLTAAQFHTLPDYSKAVRKGFMTKQPSKRAKILMERVLKDKS
jgi:hypothetical protein